MWAKLAPIYLKERIQLDSMHAFLSTSVAFYDIFTRACAEIKFRSYWTRKWPTSVGFSFLLNIFRLLLPFSSSDRASATLACSSKTPGESVIEPGIQGVAKSSCRKFCFEFFWAFSCTFLAPSTRSFWSGILRKIFSSCSSLCTSAPTPQKFAEWHGRVASGQDTGFVIRRLRVQILHPAIRWACVW